MVDASLRATILDSLQQLNREYGMSIVYITHDLTTAFQISDNVHVLNSESYGHAGYGIHPGTGSANALVKGCNMHDNGDIGLFLCWRVRHGRFEDNIIENNGHYGISIGHKDTDNEFTGNTVAANGVSGVYFRKETPNGNPGKSEILENFSGLDREPFFPRRL